MTTSPQWPLFMVFYLHLPVLTSIFIRFWLLLGRFEVLVFLYILYTNDVKIGALLPELSGWIEGRFHESQTAERAGISKNEVSLWEFNEAFAAVILANQKASRCKTSNGPTDRMLTVSLSNLDTRPPIVECQYPERCYLTRARVRQLRAPYSHESAASVAIGTIWSRSYL